MIGNPAIPIETLHKWLDEEYDTAKRNINVTNAAAHATYKVWRRADAIKKKGTCNGKIQIT